MVIDGLLCTKDPTGIDYRGTLSVTYSGRTCQRWDQRSPQFHLYFDMHFPHDVSISRAENYCR